MDRSQIEIARLFIKPTCPWCLEAIAFFESRGIAVEKLDITKNEEYARMLYAVSGQTRVPTFSYGNFVVADFDIDEFLQAIKEASDETQEALGF